MMKTRWVCTIVVLIAVAVVEGLAQDRPGAIDEFTVHGLKVILKPNPANEIVSAQLFLRGGAMNLTAETQGIEQLIFQSAMKGSVKYPKDQLNALFDHTGGVIGSVSTKDFTGISLRCVKSDFASLWDAFADLIMAPAFVPQDVELVRQNLLLAIKQRYDNPDNYLNELADSVFFVGHPYRFKPGGSEASISALTIPQMKAYLHDNLVASKLLLVVVGNISRAELEPLVVATFGTLPAGTGTPVLPSPIKHAAGSLLVREKAIPTNYIIGDFALPSVRGQDYYAMLVTMDILRTRLFEEVRTKRNLSYAPAAGSVNQLANHGFIYVTAVNPDTTIKVMLTEVRKLQTQPVSAEDLRERIALFLTSYNVRNETNAAQGQFIALYALANLGVQQKEGFINGIRAVRAEDVQRVATKYFRDMQFVVVGNPKVIDKKAFGL